MFKTVQKSALTVAAIGALALGGSAFADAASKSTSKTSTTTTTAKQRVQREALSDSVAAKVKAAALDKVPGATVVRVESGGPNNSAYHAHIKTSSGTLQVVLVNSSFEATSVQADNGPGGGGGRGGHGGHHGGGAGETALTGDTKDKVEAAVLDKYAGATIVRTETNAGDSNAPYESHITTKDGKQLEVTVSKTFEIVASNAQPSHP
jgi:uncharacterized membrane protein YkoI